MSGLVWSCARVICLNLLVGPVYPNQLHIVIDSNLDVSSVVLVALPCPSEFVTILLLLLLLRPELRG